MQYKNYGITFAENQSKEYSVTNVSRWNMKTILMMDHCIGY